jgi:hypothetical protein
MMSSCTETPHGAELLLQTAVELGDQQAGELARLAHLSARYHRTLYRALYYARHDQMARVIAVLERALARDRKLL